jgi:hypothetical protein
MVQVSVGSVEVKRIFNLHAIFHSDAESLWCLWLYCFAALFVSKLLASLEVRLHRLVLTSFASGRGDRSRSAVFPG